MKKTLAFLLFVALVFLSSCISSNPLANETWENETDSNGKKVLHKSTKEYNGDKDDYTLTTLEYTNGEYTGKSVLVYTNGIKTREEEYKYDGDTVLLEKKCEYMKDKIDTLAYLYIYEITETDDSQTEIWEIEHYYLSNGNILKAIEKFYTKDGTLYKIDEITRKEMNGYDCRYSVLTYYEGEKIVNTLRHTYTDDLKTFSYAEWYEGADELLYTTTHFSDGHDMYTFPGLGGYNLYSASQYEFEFFDANNVIFAKARLTNNQIKIYEALNDLTLDEAQDKALPIIDEARKFGL